MSDVASLLASIGLERWASTFEEEELDLELLSSMGVHLRASLEELGLPSADIDSLEAALAKSDGGDDGDDDLMLEENADEGDEDTPQLEDNPGDDDDGGLVVEDNEPAEKLPANGYAPYGRRRAGWMAPSSQRRRRSQSWRWRRNRGARTTTWTSRKTTSCRSPGQLRGPRRRPPHPCNALDR